MQDWWMISSGASAWSLPDLLIHVKVALPPPGPHVVLSRSLGWHLLDGDLSGGWGRGGLLGDSSVLPGDRHHVGHQVTPLTPGPHLVSLGLAEPDNNVLSRDFQFFPSSLWNEHEHEHVLQRVSDGFNWILDLNWSIEKFCHPSLIILKLKVYTY